MLYRRNVDDSLRDLERQALQGDPDAKEHLLRVMSRAGMIPILKPRYEEAPPLRFEEYLRRIDIRYWHQYLGLIAQLQKHQMSFRLRPDNPYANSTHTCNCENQDDCLIHPNLTCYWCNQNSLQIVPGEVSDPQPDYGQPGGYPVVRCGNVRCLREQHIQLRIQQGSSLENALEEFPKEKELSVGRCTNFAWRAYEEVLGGLCDDCMSRYPISHHDVACQCPICSEGIGPIVTVPSRIITPEQMQVMLVEYRLLFNDLRTVEIPFNIDYDDPYADAWWNVPPASNVLRLDQYSTHLIEIRPDGKYRLRLPQHQNEKQLLPRFLDILNQRRQIVGHPGALLFEYHMVGRDFDLSSLIDHLIQNYPPPGVPFLQYF